MKIVALIMGVVGLALIGVYGHWAVAVGVFLCEFGHNIERHA